MTTFDDAVWMLVDGRVTFDEFVQVTRPRWRALAANIARRWRMPAWAALEDVEQELLLGAWQSVWKFEAGRGTIGRYVVWNAMDKAKKRVHRWRGANLHRQSDSAASHIDKPFSAFGEDSEDLIESMTAMPPDQLEALARKEHLAEVELLCKTRFEILAIQAIVVTESMEGAALLLYGDKDTRLAARFGNEAAAGRAVMRAAGAVADRMVA